MSGIVITAPILGLLTAAGVWLTARLGAGYFGYDRSKLTIGCVLPLLVFAISTVCCFVWIPAASTHSGVGVSAEVANGHLMTFDLPDEAVNVDFRTCIYDGLTDAAEFDISEDNFLRWMASENRTPERFEIVDDEIVWSNADANVKYGDSPACAFVTPVSSILDGHTTDEVQVKRGYYFDNYDPLGDDSGLTIVYDISRRRVFMWETTF